MQIDVAANRAVSKWTWREQIARFFWTLAVPFFRLSPRPLWGWRRMLLRLFGARIGQAVHIYPTVRVTIPWNLDLEDDCAVGDRVILYALGPIRVGCRSTVSQGAHLCAGTHDWRQANMPLIKASISIGCDAWIAADAFIGPGVAVGDRAIVGARGVVMRDVEPNVIVAGNPAREIRKR